MVRPRIFPVSDTEGLKGSQRFLMRVFIITLIPLTLAGAIFLFLCLYLFLRGAPFLGLKEVMIEGNSRISRNEVRTIAGLQHAPNILTLDIKAMNRRLGGHPWIKESMVKRIFPDGIRIVIQERDPIAFIHLGKLYYVDETGEIFDQAEGRNKTAYPILTGLSRSDLENGEEKTSELLHKAIDLLKMTHNLKILPYRSISQIHLDRAVGLLVYTTDRGIEYRMGFADFETKLRRLAKIWPNIRPMELFYIDCTIPRKIIIQTKGSDSVKATRQMIKRKQSETKGGERDGKKG